MRASSVDLVLRREEAGWLFFGYFSCLFHSDYPGFCQPEEVTFCIKFKLIVAYTSQGISANPIKQRTIWKLSRVFCRIMKQLQNVISVHSHKTSFKYRIPVK